MNFVTEFDSTPSRSRVVAYSTVCGLAITSSPRMLESSLGKSEITFSRLFLRLLLVKGSFWAEENREKQRKTARSEDLWDFIVRIGSRAPKYKKALFYQHSALSFFTDFPQ